MDRIYESSAGTMLDSGAAVADWLRGHLRRGEGLTHPYARKLEIANYVPEHSLWAAWTEDRLLTFGDGLIGIHRPVRTTSDGVRIELPGGAVNLAANRSAPGDGLPDAYLLQVTAGQAANYTGDSPEVIVEMVRHLVAPVPPRVDDDRVQVGFPGRQNSATTYVGSWQWDIHGEARGAEFVARAAAATLAAIEAAERD